MPQQSWSLEDQGYSAATGRKRGFAYYGAKDEEVAKEASVGFMFWDGKSMGTLANIFRLVKQRKKVVVYLAPTRTFMTLKDESDWERFLCRFPREVRQQLIGDTRSRVDSPAGLAQRRLL